MAVRRTSAADLALLRRYRVAMLVGALARGDQSEARRQAAALAPRRGRGRPRLDAPADARAVAALVPHRGRGRPKQTPTGYDAALARRASAELAALVAHWRRQFRTAQPAAVRAAERLWTGPCSVCLERGARCQPEHRAPGDPPAGIYSGQPRERALAVVAGLVGCAAATLRAHVRRLK